MRSADSHVGSCGCFGSGGGSEDRKERFLLIKGPFCFVFTSEDAPSPKYAVGLQAMRPKVKAAAGRDGRVTVLLENSLGDLQYEASFASEEIANQFKAAVEQQAAAGEAEAARIRLGHGGLVKKRASTVFAAAIAKEKERAQPDVPLTTTDIIANMPEVGHY
jgi:hypothetical protein